ncbi:MAG: amidohydrolase [Coriobacteriales bacterium]|jgi:5-methylthioadenosine/S-adenosylhomocysteine deaminase|nr:amidohydrolase [Coriobacteriales bacterium]
MLFTNISYLNSDFEIVQGFVGVTDGRIEYLGQEAPPPGQAASFSTSYSGKGRLLIPGLYNTHSHVPMTLLRGYAEGLPLQSWLYDSVFPFEAKITSEHAYPATCLAIAEMLRFGTVAFTDMYFFMDARARAVAESGIKANLCDGFMAFDDDVRYAGSEAAAANERYAQSYHNSYDGRLRIDLNIHSEYISNPHVVREVAEHAVALGLGTHTHISETRLEHEQCKQRRGGMTPVAYFDSLGFFAAPCTAAHCVFTEPGDWEILRERGVTVAANPASNMKLASGFAPVPEMLDAGLNVALGTDGVASNNSHDILKELYLLALIYKGASGDATVVGPAQALRAATLAGARSQGRLDCGTIALGNRADLVVLDVDVPWMRPVNDLRNNLVFSAKGSDVVLTMVDGKVLYRDGEYLTLDVEKAAFEAQQATDTIRAAL